VHQCASYSGPGGLIAGMSEGPQCCSCLPRYEFISNVVGLLVFFYDDPQWGSRCIVCLCGRKTRLARHVQNDWLLGCWIFFFGSLLLTIAIFARGVVALLDDSDGLAILYFLG
jgi:hypothetical protein